MKILVIVEPDRTDWYHYLTKDTQNQFYLLWHETDADIPEKVRQNSFFKGIYNWSAFVTAKQLLKKTKPDRIVFFEIIDQRQIALLVTANRAGIKTFYLEHGAAGNKEAAIQRANEENFFSKVKKQYLLNRLRRGLGRLIRSKMFYYSASCQFSSLSSAIKYMRLPFAMLFETPNKALANCIFPERIPFRSIVFNKPNFEQLQVYTGITEDKAVFTGVPIFDNYYSQECSDSNFISYIDHPYLEEKILEWTHEHHRKISQNLFEFARSRQLKILVKLHPRSDLSLWQQYRFDPAILEVVQMGDYTKQLLSSKLILAYSSSLVNGFLCARKNVVLLGWHPQPRIFGADFSKSGLCHVSLFPDELKTKFDYWIDHNLSKYNQTRYEHFLKEFNYPFDGRAGERVLEAIIDHEVH